MKSIDKETLHTYLEHSRRLREYLMADRDRPTYHFICPEDDGNPGDPNAAFYAIGRYHLMFLYHCCSDGFRYGHMSSADLLHWTRHPDALIPDELDGGIFSGGAFVDADGTAYISYWALKKGNFDDVNSGIRLAYSRDIANHYTAWTKMTAEAVPATENGCRTVRAADGTELHLAAADPSNIWRKGEYYYLQAGNLPVLQRYGGEKGEARYRGDFTDLYRSRDLVHWEYVHRFYQRKADNSWTDETEDDMCPSFLPLPRSVAGGEASGRYLQLFIAHNRGAQYYIGQYDTGNDRFLPERHGRMSWQDNSFFAPEALMAPDGRQLMWAWLKDNRRDEVQRFGWSGVFSLPRSLALAEDGSLLIAPAQELRSLRANRRDSLTGLRSRTCEIRAVLEPAENARMAGLRVFATPDGREETLVYYDARTQELVVDGTKSYGDRPGIVERAPFALRSGELLELDVFLDRSVVEVFANGRQAVCRRIYTASQEADAVSFCLEGDVRVRELDVWDMIPTNPY